jgi:DNA-binding LacI/PurR family transcriptional regulator
MSVRMGDVASKAGASVSTVSKVLHGQGVAMQPNVETTKLHMARRVTWNRPSSR